MAITLKGAITGLTIAYATHKTISLALLAVEMVRGIYENNLIARMIVSTAITYGKATALGVLTAVSKIASFSLGILTSVVSGLATVLSVLTGPVGLIVIGIVGLGVAFYNAFKKSETFRKGVGWLIDKFKELWGWIKKFTGIGAVLDFGKNVYNKAKNFFGFGDKDKSKNIVDAVNEENKKKITNTVETETKNIDNSKGKGINTDYLLFGDSNQGNTNNDKYIHNGYYLKGTKNLSTSYSGIKNISNNSSSTVNSAVTNNKNINNTLNDYNTNSSLENVINNNKNVTNLSKFEGDKKSNEENDFSTSNNVYNSYSTSQNKVIEKSPEEKIVELLTNIKDLLSSKKSSDSKVQINVI